MLVTNKHSIQLLASYQVLVDAGLFSAVVVNELPLVLARKLYPTVYNHLNVTNHPQTGGIEIKPNES